MYQKKPHGAVQVIEGRAPLTKEHADDAVPIFEQCMVNGQPMAVLDLTRIPLIDSAGLELLLDVQDQYQQRGGALKLASANALCQDILAATGVGSRFEIFDDVTKAVGSFIR